MRPPVNSGCDPLTPRMIVFGLANAAANPPSPPPPCPHVAVWASAAARYSGVALRGTKGAHSAGGLVSTGWRRCNSWNWFWMARW